MYLHITAPNVPSLADSGNIVLNIELNSDEFFLYREVPRAMYRTNDPRFIDGLLEGKQLFFA